jgi:hypothetical protein
VGFGIEIGVGVDGGTLWVGFEIAEVVDLFVDGESGQYDGDPKAP